MAASIRTINTDAPVDALLNRNFVSTVRTGFIEIGEDNYCLPIYYRDCQEYIRNFPVRDGDVFVATHPKAGTTWVTEMVWLLLHDLNYEAAKEYLQYRCPLLELPALYDANYIVPNDDCLTTAELLELAKSPRCIRTHLHWSLLPEQILSGVKQAKIIVVLRNPMDTCVSYYHHCKLIEGYKGNFEDFCELFLAGRVPYGPFWKQVLSYWQHRDKPNVYFIRYEDMKSNLLSVITGTCKFLGKTYSENQVDALGVHLSFDSMKNNPAVNFENIVSDAKRVGLTTSSNAFIRSGKVGDHKSTMCPELIKKFETWTEKHFTGSDLIF